MRVLQSVVGRLSETMTKVTVENQIDLLDYLEMEYDSPKNNVVIKIRNTEDKYVVGEGSIRISLGVFIGAINQLVKPTGHRLVPCREVV